MKPFDLEKALAGEPVVTRDGRPVTQVTRFDVNNERYCIAAVVDSNIETFSIDGKFRIEYPSIYDLFMAPKTVKKEGWINLYRSDSEEIAAFTGNAYNTKEAAEEVASPKCIATVKIEWEEEI